MALACYERTRTLIKRRLTCALGVLLTTVLVAVAAGPRDALWKEVDDATKKEYVSYWVDNFAPQMTHLRGNCDDSGKIVTYKGESMGPAGQPVNTTNTMTFKDADHWTMTMKSVTKDGKDAGTMTMKYTRSK